VAQQNLELVRRAFEAWNTGEVDALMEPYAGDVVVITPPSFPEGGTLEGHDELRRFFETLRQGWESGGRVSIGELSPLGEDRVFAEFEWHARGETSGVETELATLGLFTVRDGKIAHAQFFFDREDALRAAGLAD
jgi:ketosteroid isomerase-like protein